MVEKSSGCFARRLLFRRREVLRWSLDVALLPLRKLPHVVRSVLAGRDPWHTSQILRSIELWRVHRGHSQNDAVLATSWFWAFDMGAG